MIIHRLAVLPAVVLWLSGCGALPSHFHDETAAALTVKLQTEFAAYRQDQTSVYSNMAANIASFQTEEDELLSRFATNVQTALITRAPALTWNKLDKEIENTKKDRSKFHQALLEQMQKDLVQLGVAKAELATTEEAISKLKKEIKHKKDETKKWGDSIEILQKAIAKLPADIEALGRMDASLDLIGDIQDLKDKLSLSIADAPGIAIRILELGLELAELKKRNAENKLVGLRLRDEMYQEAFVYSRIAEILLQEADDMSALAEDENKRDTPVVVSILRIKESTGPDPQDVLDSTDRMTSRLYALRAYATAKWFVLYQESSLPVRLARLAHQDSVTESHENDRAWQALIGSGIDALVDYHKGGVKKEDIANIVRLAQSIALFIIAS